MAAQDLVSLSDAKTWLEVTGSSEDALIGAQITTASSAILSYLDRSVVVAQTVTETYDGRGSSTLVTKNFPINSVSSLVVNDTALTAATNTTSAGFRFDRHRIFLNNGGRFPKGFQNVVLTYNCGHSTVPEEIKQAALMMLQALRSSQSIDPNILSENVPGAYSASYDSRFGAGSVPMAARTMLASHRRVSMS